MKRNFEFNSCPQDKLEGNHWNRFL
jgi:hypothetical protein